MSVDGVFDFHKYLLAPVDNSSAVNILEWWRDNESVYPTTVVVTRGFLSLPATLVQWERLFQLLSYHETELAAPPGQIESRSFFDFNEIWYVGRGR